MALLCLAPQSLCAWTWDPHCPDDWLFDSLLDPHNPDTIRQEYGRAVRALRQRDFADAARRLQSLPRELAEGRNLLGVVAAVCDDGKSALEYFQQSRRLQPENLAPWINTGALFFRWKAWDRLGELAEELERLRHGQADALLGLGLAAYGRQEYEKAAGFLVRARDRMDVEGNPRVVLAREYLQRVRSTRRRVFQARPR